MNYTYFVIFVIFVFLSSILDSCETIYIISITKNNNRDRESVSIVLWKYGKIHGTAGVVSQKRWRKYRNTENFTENNDPKDRHNRLRSYGEKEGRS